MEASAGGAEVVDSRELVESDSISCGFLESIVKNPTLSANHILLNSAVSCRVLREAGSLCRAEVSRKLVSEICCQIRTSVSPAPGE